MENIDYIICPICNKEFKQITFKHIKTHNLTIEKFKNIYPDQLLLCKNTFEKRSKLGKKNKDQIAWNKGLTREMDERVLKYCNSQKGKKRAIGSRQKQSKARKQLQKEGLLRIWNRGKTKETNEVIKEVSENSKRNKKIGKASKKRWEDKDYRKNFNWNTSKVSKIELNFLKKLLKFDFYNIKISNKLKDNLFFYNENLSESFKKKSFIQQANVEGLSVDFYFPYKNKIIFIDGDYWHCNPRFYKSNFYHKQLKKTAKEKWNYDKKITQKLEKNGYKVARIWENDINNNHKYCKDILLKELQR